MGKRISWNLWFTFTVIIAGLLIAAAFAVLAFSLSGTIHLPVTLSEADYFVLLMFFGMMGFGDLYLLYSALISFDRDRYNDW